MIKFSETVPFSSKDNRNFYNICTHIVRVITGTKNGDERE